MFAAAQLGKVLAHAAVSRRSQRLGSRDKERLREELLRAPKASRGSLPCVAHGRNCCPLLWLGTCHADMPCCALAVLPSTTVCRSIRNPNVGGLALQQACMRTCV